MDGFGATLTYHLEGIARPAGCDGECADLRTGNARGAAGAGAEEEGRDLARHCERIEACAGGRRAEEALDGEEEEEERLLGWWQI